jgi:hypothetical protein
MRRVVETERLVLDPEFGSGPPPAEPVTETPPTPSFLTTIRSYIFQRAGQGKVLSFRFP